MMPGTRTPGEGQAGIAQQGAAGTGQPARTTGGSAVVASVDRTGNCLRVRSGPSVSSNEIGCLAKGQTVHLNGVFSKDGRWAQLDNNGWVYFRQLKSDVRPPQSMSASNAWGRSAATGSGSRSGGSSYRGGYCGYYAPGYYYTPGYYYAPGYYSHRGFRRGGMLGFWGY
jgi:hypothetical protein